jgi:hypothetical protein
MALSGVPDRIIQAVGRWKSDAYKTYIDANDEELRTAHASASITRDADLHVGLGTGRPGWMNHVDIPIEVTEDRLPLGVPAAQPKAKKPRKNGHDRSVSNA